MKKTELPAVRNNQRLQIRQFSMADYYLAIIEMVPNQLINEVVAHFINKNGVNIDINDRIGFGGFHLPLEDKTCLIAYNPETLKFEYITFESFVDMANLNGEYAVENATYYSLEKEVEDYRLETITKEMLNDFREVMIRSHIMLDDGTLGGLCRHFLMDLHQQTHYELN